MFAGERLNYCERSAECAVMMPLVVHDFTHAGAKTAKPEEFIDNSILAELEKAGFVKQLHGP